MKFIVGIILLMTGCTDKDVCEMVKGAHAFYGKYDVSCNNSGFDRPYKRTQIIHDYIFQNGRKECAKINSDLHYVVQETSIQGVGDNDYPCSEITKFRCQDGTLINFDTGIKYCFISESQLQESL